MTRDEFISALDEEMPVEFDLLRYLCALVANEEEVEARELLCFALEKSNTFSPNFQDALSAMCRSLGLYPYMAGRFSLSDSLVVAANQEDKLGLVLHREQARIVRTVIDGNNLILSAPTSFGKSTVIDAVLASHKFDQVAIVVPTIALIDELRIRFSKHSDYYKIITNASQVESERNVFILTPERVCEWPRPFQLKLFIIDEFYKLDPFRKDQRAITLNAAFARLYGIGTQFYLLGPNIDTIKPTLHSDQLEALNATFERSDFHTVAARIHRVESEEGLELDSLVAMCSDLAPEPTIVYFKSPDSLRTACDKFLQSPVSLESSGIENAISWCSSAVSSNWSFVRALKVGIGMHHGRLPRALSHWVVKAYNDGRLNLLFCTSTLIEGVNTRAKNVIVFDNKIANRKFDFFTFSNIRGRAGRMSKHFVGDVYLFHEPPLAEQKEVLIPVLEQDDDTSLSVLLNIDPSKLNGTSKARLDKLISESPLPLEILRSNSEIDPSLQVDLAREILRSPPSYDFMRWKGAPNYKELRATLEVAFKIFKVPPKDPVRSVEHLAFLLLQAQSALTIRDLATIFSNPQKPLPFEELIEKALDFRRTWMEYKTPSLLMALHRIQEYVFSSMGLQPGDYTSFSARVANLFHPEYYAALEEYGIPLEVAQKMFYPKRFNSLDEILDSLRANPRLTDNLHPFEKELVASAKRTL